MNMFYFVGGPKAGHEAEFFRRLQQVGGTPAGWRLYPHTSQDGKALHIVRADSLQQILEHLRHFSDIYERGEIVRISERP